MKHIKKYRVYILAGCLGLIFLLSFRPGNPSAESIQQGYEEHREAFHYVKDYFFTDNVRCITRETFLGIGGVEITYNDDPGNPVLANEAKDKKLAESIEIIFDKLGYDYIWDETPTYATSLQLQFIQETNNRSYDKGIAYCEDEGPPHLLLTEALEPLEDGWFYYEENRDDSHMIG